MRRRAFLRSGLAVSLGAVAGCANSGSETETPTEAPTATQTETPEETDTPEETPTETATPEDDTPTEEEETETEQEEEHVDRPTNYRWDLKPGRNDDLRNELSQYVDSVGAVPQNHPAFDFSTERETDDHTVDFAALRMIRDSNFDIFVNEDPNSDAPLEAIVGSFIEESLYEDAKTDSFVQNDSKAPGEYSAEEWLNADTVEDSLDLGHNLLVSIFYEKGNFTIEEQAVTIREAYQRHHDYDVLAWEVPLEDGSHTAGMMYSPDDDKIRAFNVGGSWSGGGEAQIHPEIQDWRVINNPENFNSTNDPTRFQHPILLHTDEWDRQGISFHDAKQWAVAMIYGIGTEEYSSYNLDATGVVDEIGMTTGAAKQLTRTMLDYNKPGVDAEFADIRNLADFAVGKFIQDAETTGVIDTVRPGESEYDEYFDGWFAFYELGDIRELSGGPDIPVYEPDFRGTPIGDKEPRSERERRLSDFSRALYADRDGTYNRFGELYDELNTAA